MKIRLLIYVLLLLFSIRGYSQNCTLAFSLSESEPTICSGNSISLKATVLSGKAPFSYVWSTGETTATIEVNKAGTYTVTVTDATSGCQPVKQSINVTATPTPDAPTAKGQTVCPNSQAALMATAPGGSYQWYDADGNFLMSGASYTTPPITTATTYYVQTTLNGCTSDRTAVNVFITGKPTVTGATICSGSVATLMATGGDTYAWYPTSSATGAPLSTDDSYTTPALTSTKTYYVVVTSNGCVSSPTPVIAVVTPTPQPPTVTNQTICAGTNITLQATVPSGIVNWYSTATGTVPLISSPTYTTPILNGTTTYYVENDVNDCISSRVPLTVTVTANPQAPATKAYSICYQNSAVLTAGNSALTYKWYDAATGGNLIYTGATYTTPVLTTSTTYYVELVNGSCVSYRTAIVVTVKPMLAAPSVSGDIICPGSMATLTPMSPSGTYQWYNVATGGTPIATTTSYTTPALTANATYYVENTVSGCTSPRTAVTVSVFAAPAAPTVTNTSVCSGSPAVISASSPTDSYSWYSAATGGTLLSTAQVYVTPDLTATTTYYVEALSTNGCASARTPLTVTVNAIPAAPTASNVSICANNMATLNASAPSGTIQWYDAPTGGNMVATGSAFVTPVLNANTTYYVQNVINECVSSRTMVTVTVNQLINPQFQYSSGSQCTASPNPTPVLFNPDGGTFSASPAGLVFVNTTTGEVNTAASTPGNYTISYAGNGPCPHTSTATFGIISSANANFSYSGPYCQDGVNPRPAFAAGASGGVFTASPSGLVFVDPSTGEIDLIKSQSGTYTVTNTIDPSGGCSTATATAKVTIYPKVNVSAGPSQTVETGTPVQLAGVINGGIGTGTWSGGSGHFSDNREKNALYTPGAGETQVTLTLTSDDPPGVCGPVSNTVIIYFIAPPPAPTVTGTTICAGTNTTLAATAPGGKYEWFVTPTGTEGTYGQTYTTLWLDQTTTYYVQTTINGFTSARTVVTVTVDPVPAAPVVAPVQACSGNRAMLMATGSTGSYEWYDAAVGGNLLYVGSNYLTPALETNTSYYVQAHNDNCISPRTEVDIPVGGVPSITSESSDDVCSGTALGYTITTNQALGNITYSWSRAAITGISNQAVSGQTSSTINETLINTSANPVKVTYVIIASNGSCAGPAFNYVVTVNPVPVVTSPNTATICNQNTDDYQITFSSPVNAFTWSRAAVAGISNVAVSGQSSPVIQEVLFNTTNAPIVVPYTINYQSGSCSGMPFTLNITVDPAAIVISDATGTVCSGTAQNYAITSNVPSATYSWSRNAVNNISNDPVSNQTSSVIDETLLNTSTSPANVTYTIVPQAYGCPGTPFKYVVTVNPVGKKPVANGPTYICLGSTINLKTQPVAGATYLWTGPNNFSSTEQNPNIPNSTLAMAGTYTLTVTNKQGCPAPSNSTNVEVDAPGVAIAGANQTVCSTVTAISLNGQVTGGQATGIWSASGTSPGTFSSYNSLITQYFPSDADRAAGSVVLTLMTTSLAGCASSTSSLTITFGPEPGVDAGASLVVCSQETAVQLSGKLLVPGLTVQWSGGTGTFSPSASDPAAIYMPSAADEASGKVILTLSIINGGLCYQPSDTTSITFLPPPKLNPGGIVYVLKGHQITLNPVVSESGLTYSWSPDNDISSVDIENPVITGNIDQIYTLTVTDSRGCQATTTFDVKVSPPIVIPNTFTPNGDGVNDKWEITGLIAYTQATVDIFNRYGQKLFHSVGYPIPWDGTYDNKPVPSGEYYYVINTNYNNQVLAGHINLVR